VDLWHPFVVIQDVIVNNDIAGGLKGVCSSVHGFDVEHVAKNAKRSFQLVLIAVGSNGSNCREMFLVVFGGVPCTIT
jgi:hypothetical protein